LKADEEKLFILEKIDAPKVLLPPQNQNKKFERVDVEAMKGVSDEFKLAVQIYKFNMTKQPAYLDRLADFFKGSMDDGKVLRLLHFLGDFGIVESAYGGIGDGRAGKLFYVDSGEVWEIRKVYETYVRPYEKPEDQIDYVPDLMIEK